LQLPGSHEIRRIPGRSDCCGGVVVRWDAACAACCRWVGVTVVPVVGLLVGGTLVRR
jgi:hypothetical protein